MSKGDNMRKHRGAFDAALGMIVDGGYVKASHVKTALGIVTHTVWRRTLADAGITTHERDETGRAHWLTVDDARRLLAGSLPAKPP